MVPLVDPVIGASPARLAHLVSALGEDGFANQLLKFFGDVCGVDYCSVFSVNQNTARSVALASFSLGDTEIAHQQASLYLDDQRRWERDPMIAQARGQLDRQPVGIVHTTVNDLPAGDYRDLLYHRANVCDRVLLCSRSATGITGLSLLRTARSGTYSSDDVAHLSQACEVLMAIIGKHVGLVSQGDAGPPQVSLHPLGGSDAKPLGWGRSKAPNISEALTSLPQIEASLSVSPVPLSQREAAVCARVLYGMSSLGIALDLGIGEETVMTYRKRAYQRLGIGSQRELVVWYLDLWGATHLCGHRRVQ